MAAARVIEYKSRCTVNAPPLLTSLPADSPRAVPWQTALVIALACAVGVCAQFIDSPCQGPRSRHLRFPLWYLDALLGAAALGGAAMVVAATSGTPGQAAHLLIALSLALSSSLSHNALVSHCSDSR